MAQTEPPLKTIKVSKATIRKLSDNSVIDTLEYPQYTMREINIDPEDEYIKIERMIIEETRPFNLYYDKIITVVNMSDPTLDLGTTDTYVLTNASGAEIKPYDNGTDKVTPGDSAYETFEIVDAKGDTVTGFMRVGMLENRLASDGTRTISIPMVSMSETAAAAVRADGTVWVWGDNNHNKLYAALDDDQPYIYQPGVMKTYNASGELEELTNVKEVVEGTEFTAYLTHDGSVFVVGINNANQAGNGVQSGVSEYRQPEQVYYGANTPLSGIVSIAGYESHLVALSDEGKVYTWGAANSDKLGDNVLKQNYYAKPVRMTNVQAIAAGKDHTVALKTDGTVWTWGDNTYGQLGDRVLGYDNNVPDEVKLEDDAATGDPVPLTGVVAIAAGEYSTVVLTADGKVHAWGQDYTDIQKDILSNATQIDARGNQITATTVDGSSYAWNNGTTSVTTAVTSLAAQQVITTAAGSTHALAIKADGSAYAWGANEHYQLGDSTNNDSDVVIPVNIAPKGLVVTKIDVDGTTITGNTTTDRKYEFTIKNGQKLTVESVSKYIPYRFSVLGAKRWIDASGITLESLNPEIAIITGGNVIETIAGRYGTVYIKITDDSNYGVDGRPNVGFIKINVIPTDAAAIVAPMISAGTDFNVALKDDGTVWAWGSNFNHKVNGNTTDVYETATQINFSSVLGTGEYITKVAAGESHALALTSLGNVYAWGRNEFAQLGNGDQKAAAEETPVRVANITDITDISAGADFSLAVAKDGTVWAWGNNAEGQIGRKWYGDSIYKTPVRVTGFDEDKYLSDIVSVSAGGHHATALNASGVVYAWGRNVNEQLGLMDKAEREAHFDVAREVLGNKDSTFKYNVAKISAGDEHSMALTAGADADAVDGDIWTWGYNYYGRLGNGNGDTTNEPVNVVTAPNYNTYVLTGIVDIDAGITHSLAVSSDNKVYAWGDNQNGQLGTGSYAQKSTAELVVLTDTTTPVNGIAAGNEHSAMFKNNGEIWTWGNNIYAQLGADRDTYKNSNVPICIGSEDADVKGITINTVKVGSQPDYKDPVKTVTISPTDTAKLVADLTTDGVTLVDSITSFSVYNSLGASTVGVPVPMSTLTVTTDSDLIDITPDTAALTFNIKAKSAISLGIATVTVTYNNAGKTYEKKFDVVIKPEYEDGSSAVVTGGIDFSVALNSQGEVYTWGNNDRGQLGLGEGTSYRTYNPEKITSLTNVKEVVAGKEFAVAVTNTGDVYTWGANDYGQLGVGPTTTSSPTVDYNTPQHVTFSGLASGEKVVRVAAGDDFAVALTDAGHVYVWGDNRKGQLGNGQNNTNGYYRVPNLVSSISDAKMITAGARHVMVYTDNGTTKTVYTWGDNNSGQLGRTGSALSPAAITMPGSLSINVTQIAARGEYSAIVADDGNLYLWGNNSHGQLANGTVTNETSSYSATVVTIPEDEIVKVSLGESHVIALTKASKVYAWGENSSGQLGIGTTEGGLPAHRTPNAVHAGDTSTAGLMSSMWGVGAGYNTSFVITSDGLVYAWGPNESGQLGIGRDVDRLVGGVMPTETTAKQVQIADRNGLVVNKIETIGDSSYDKTFTTTGPDFIQYDLFMTQKQTMQIDLSSIEILAANNNFNVFNTSNSIITTTAKASELEFESLDENILEVSGAGVVTLGNLASANGFGTTIIKVHETSRNLTTYLEVAVRNNYIDGDGIPRLSPRAVPGILESHYIDDPTYAWVKNDGSLWVWGGDANVRSRLLSVNDDFGNPHDLSNDLTSTNKIVQVVKGLNFTMALTSDGRIVGWGENAAQQLGLPGNTSQVINKVRQAQSTVIDASDNVKTVYYVQIAAGKSHMIALTDEGEVYTWGNNRQHQLGNETSGLTTQNPALVDFGSGVTIKQIASLDYGGAALATDGHVYVWGYANEPTAEEMEALPAGWYLPHLQVAGESTPDTNGNIADVIRLANIGNVITTSTRDNETYAWGDGTAFGKTISSETPVAYAAHNSDTDLQLDVIYAQVMKGTTVDYVTTISGGTELGDYKDSHPLPTRIQIRSDQEIHINLDEIRGKATLPFADVYDTVAFELAPYSSSVSTKDRVTFSTDNDTVITILNPHDGIIRAKNVSGTANVIVTDDVLGSRYVFTVDVSPSGGSVSEELETMVVSGFGHTLALRADGTIWAWGDNTYGQLGDGTKGSVNVDKMVPRMVRVGQDAENGNAFGLVTSIPAIVAIAAGGNASAAVDAYGDLYLWGQNNGRFNSFGLTASEYAYPTKVNTGISKGVSKIVIGENHMFILERETRYLYSYGNDSYHQLYPNSYTRTDVVTSKFIDIAR